jgi:hypothetical protein
LSFVRGNHLSKIGGEVRMVRMETDQLGGTTYTFPNVTAFLANQFSILFYRTELLSIKMTLRDHMP